MNRILTSLLLSLVVRALAVEVSLPNIRESEGKKITLAIASTDVTQGKVFSCDFTLIYDATLLTATDVQTNATLMAAWGTPTVNIGSGQLRVSAGGTQALAGSGTLIKINFKVAAGVAIGRTTVIAFSSFLFNEGLPTATLSNGSFTVIADTEAPRLVAGPSVSSITSRSALVGWTTNEAATSRVEYGETAAYGMSTNSQALVLSHALTLAPLQAGKTYHFRVASSDQAGNGPVYSADQTFTAQAIVMQLPDLALDAGANLLLPLTVSDLTDQQVVDIRFTLRYDPHLLTPVSVNTDATLTALWPAPSFSTAAGEIQIQLNGATPLSAGGTLLKIEFLVASAAAIGQKTDLELDQVVINQGRLIAKARKGSFTVKDTRPPIIIAGPTVDYVSASSALISWETNEKSTSIVRFGQTTAYGRTAQASLLTIRHQLELVGLSAATLYHLSVSGYDSSGNGPVESKDRTFTTQSMDGIPIALATVQGQSGQQGTLPVTIGEVDVHGISRYTMVIAYDVQKLELREVRRNSLTNPAWSAFRYEPLPGQVIVSDEGTLPLAGSGELFSLVFLVKNEAYDGDSEVRFQFCGLNSGKPEASLKNGLVHIIGHPDVKMPSFTLGPVMDEITPHSARVTWFTDEPAEALLEYGLSSSYGQTLNQPGVRHWQQLNLTGLSSATLYHLRVGARDAQGNGPAWSDDFSFTTLDVNGIATSAGEVHTAAGANFTLTVQTGNVSGQEIYSLYLAMQFNPSLLTVVNATSSSTLTSGWGEPTFTASNGRLVVAMGGIQPLSGSGPLLKINFLVKGTAPAGIRTPLIFEKFTFNEGRPATTISNGMVYVDDLTTPVITGGPLSVAITSSSCQLVWTTDEPASALVEFGESITYDHALQEAQLETSHSLSLRQLKENTSYHYRVSGVDSSGNGPVWSADQTFRTASVPGVVLSLPDTVAGLSDSLQLSLFLNNRHSLGVREVEGSITYNPRLVSLHSINLAGTLATSWTITQRQHNDSTLYFTLAGADLYQSGVLAFIHGVVKDGAKKDQSSVLILSKAIVNRGQIPVEVKNGRVTILDLAKPEFKEGPSVQYISSNSATIFWRSSKPCRSQLQYGLTTDYGSQVDKGRLTKEEQITLTGLKAQTTYHYRVGLWDSLGQGPIWSNDAMFATLEQTLFTLTVAMRDTSAMQGSTLALPVLISSVSGLGIRAIGFEVNYEPTVLAPAGIVTSSTLTQGWTQSFAIISPGKLAVRLESVNDLEGTGILLRLLLRINEAAAIGTITNVVLEKVQFNNGQLQPTSIGKASVTVLAALAQDPIYFSVVDTTVWPHAFLLLPVRAANLIHRTITTLDLTIQADPAILQFSGVDTVASLISGWPEQSAASTAGQIRIKAQNAGLAMNDGVLFYLRVETLPWLLSDQATAITIKEASITPANIPIQKKDGMVRIRKRADALWGRVINASTMLGLDSALVVLTDAAGNANQQLADEQGYFSFSDLNPSKTFSLKASKSGYRQQTVINEITAGFENAIVKMEPLSGTLLGMVMDDKDRPVALALVVADNGAGSFASASTDSSGRFVLQGLLPTIPYQIRLSKYGFLDLVLSHRADGSTVQIKMQWNYATIHGHIVFQDSTAASQVTVQLIESITGQVIQTINSDGAGHFSMGSLKAGNYFLTTSKSGYSGEPEQWPVTLGPGGSNWVRFTLLPAAIDHILVQGPELVANHLSTRYTYTALTSSGKQVGLSDVKWSITPTIAGTIVNGLLQPNRTFIGRAAVTVSAEKDAFQATLAIALFAEVDSRSQATLTTAVGVKITIEPSCFQDLQQLKFEEIPLSPLKRDGKNATATSSGYLFYPDGYHLFKPAVIHVPIKDSGVDQVLGIWDKETAEWHMLTSSQREGDNLRAEINLLGTFAVLQPSAPLAVELLKFSPNPFSPDVDTDLDGQTGLTIQLKVTSQYTRMPLVTINLYAMSGELIRVLMEKQPIVKAGVERINWDGLTDHKLLARNGRYLIKVIVEDGQRKTERVHTVVLIR